jgi:L-lactate dehydrogenase (cytochrome)
MQEMASAKAEGKTLYWQIYAMTDLRVTEREVRGGSGVGVQGVCING